MNQIEFKSLCKILLENHFHTIMGSVHFSAIEQTLKHLFSEGEKKRNIEIALNVFNT